jgi:hypothetical protein
LGSHLIINYAPNFAKFLPFFYQPAPVSSRRFPSPFASAPFPLAVCQRAVYFRRLPAAPIDLSAISRQAAFLAAAANAMCSPRLANAILVTRFP